MPWEGARLVLRVNNGNLIHFGGERLPPAKVAVPPFLIDSELAEEVVNEHIQGFDHGDTMIDPGSRHLIVIEAPGTEGADAIRIGKGYGLRALWQFIFEREGVMGTCGPASTPPAGEVIEFYDINRLRRGHRRRLPDLVLLQRRDRAADALCRHRPGAAAPPTRPGSTPGTAAPHLDAERPVRAHLGQLRHDLDGAPTAAATSSSRHLAAPTAPRRASGGAGNTHSSRGSSSTTSTGPRRTPAAGSPTNTWLTSQLTVNVNINQTCNAYWNGSTINFFRSGGGCGNTGEIAGVSLHEFGHGLDTNDGNGFSPDNGTGETYGDFTAALPTHTSCVGNGFLGTNCGGYGDACTYCTGVRDIDWAKHASNTPHTVANFTQAEVPDQRHLPRALRPRGHCESYIVRGAVGPRGRDLSPAAGHQRRLP